MSIYQNILVAIDFSDVGHFVAQKAQSLAIEFNAHLNLIHVLDNIPMPDTPYGTVISLHENTTYDLLEIEKGKFLAIPDQLKIDRKRCWLIWGEPQQEITQLAARERIDLIVVGSHGRHGLSMLMGSTAKGVIYHAECDVLTVHLRNDQ